MERVGLIVGKLHSGGKKNLIMEYYRNIDKTKIQFDFICDGDSNSIPEKEILSLGGRIYIVEPYQNIIKNIIDIYIICKENKYKIVHGYNGTMNIFGLFAAWLAGVKIRINESISMAHKEDRKTVLKRILKPFSSCFSTHYVANGEMCGRWQFGDRAYKKGKITIFKTVIDADKNSYDENIREKCRKEFNLEKKIVFGHIGRLTEQKNTLFVIDIFNEILKTENNAHLIIVGDGNLREEMLKKIQVLNIGDSISYLGRREDIEQFYNAMDVFLLPSLYEGLPVVGVESQAHGLPILFSSEIPRESSVCDDLCFFINLKMSPQKWAEIALKAAYNNSSIRRSRIDEIKQFGFDSKTEAHKLLEYYLKLI